MPLSNPSHRHAPKLLLTFTFTTTLLLPVTARAQRTDWISQFGTGRDEEATSVSYGEFGAYTAGDTIGVFPGFTPAGLNDRDAYISLHDETGKLRWIRQFGSTTLAEDHATGVAADGSGAYVVGYTRGALSGGGQVGGTDAFVRKYDQDGNVLWTRQFGTTSNDFLYGVFAHTSGVYVVGNVDCCAAVLPGFPPAASADAFIRKYDGNGNELWTRLYGTADADYAYSVAADATGVYVGGTTGGTLVGPAGGRDGYIRKFSHEGAVLWTRQFGALLPNGNFANDFLYAIAVGPSGVYASGATAQGSFPGNSFAGGLYDAYVTKFNTDGVAQWVRQFGTGGDDHAYGLAVGAGHVLVTGGTGGAFPTLTHVGGEDAFLRLYDPDGQVLSTSQFGNGLNDRAAGVVAYPGGFFAAGFKSGNALQQEPFGGNDAFLMRIIPPPVVPDGGIVNSASYAAHPAPLAPGSMATVFGAYLNDGPQVLSTIIGEDGKVATSLGGSSVRVNNIPAPILYSLASQLAIQIPFEMAGQTTASVVVTVGGQSSAPRTINIASAAAGIFTVNQAGTQDAIVVHSDGVTLVTPQNPARRGEVVVLYVTGLGVLDPALATGALAGANTAVTAPQLLFGVSPATLDYAGAAPSFVGLNQINARIPATAQTGAAVPILLVAAGRQANVATIAIAP